MNSARKYRAYACACVTACALAACAQGTPVTAPTVKEVDLARYMGTWYEIARFPHSFEEGLACVTAEYSPREDGGITVLNGGVRTRDGAKKSARGVALVPDPREPGKLRVSFFRPFYGDYWILALDGDYRHVLVSGSTNEYLWILSRSASMDEKTYNELATLAAQRGFDVSRLSRVPQDCR